MSGRSGYRKTGRKRKPTPPAERSDYVLRFVLPPELAFAISPGGHGWGVTVSFNDVVFVYGRHPRQCTEFAADFLFSIGAHLSPMLIPGMVLKLLPCRAYFPSRHVDTFGPLTVDLEAIHDNVQRNMHRARHCSISVGASIVFRGIIKIPLVYSAP